MGSEERTIFHVDVNSAFLSWSALKRLEEEPGSVDLRTIPSAVGGDIKTRHGVITAKSIRRPDGRARSQGALEVSAAGAGAGRFRDVQEIFPRLDGHFGKIQSPSSANVDR